MHLSANNFTLTRVVITTNERVHMCPSARQAKEQDTDRIIDTLNRCIGLLPQNKLQHVVGIGLCGQMHGVVLWKSMNGTHAVHIQTVVRGSCISRRLCDKTSLRNKERNIFTRMEAENLKNIYRYLMCGEGFTT